MKIKLTKHQLKKLQPIFQKARLAEEPGLMVGQIFQDGMKVGFIEHKKAKHLIEIMGGNTDKTIASVHEHTGKD